MASSTFNFRDSETSARTLIVATLAVVFLTGALGSKNTRAVFLTEGPGVAAKAFTAQIPVLNTLSPTETLRQRIADVLSDIVPGTAPNRQFAARPAGAGTTRGGTVLPDAALVPGTDIPGAGGTGAGIDPGTGGTGGTGSPAGGQPGEQLASVAPPGSGGAQPNPAAPAQQFPDLSAAVPEPSTWATLLAGFLFVGIGLRSSRRRGRGNVDDAALS